MDYYKRYKMGDINIVFKIPLNKKDRESVKIAHSRELNGMYIYDSKKMGKDVSYINLGSTDFRACKTEDEVINLFIEMNIHEPVHGEIFKITGYESENLYNERIIDIMTGQKEIK